MFCCSFRSVFKKCEIYQLWFILESVFNCLYEYVNAHRCLCIYMGSNVNENRSLARFVLVLYFGVSADMVEVPGS